MRLVSAQQQIALTEWQEYLRNHHFSVAFRDDEQFRASMQPFVAKANEALGNKEHDLGGQFVICDMYATGCSYEEALLKEANVSYFEEDGFEPLTEAEANALTTLMVKHRALEVQRLFQENKTFRESFAPLQTQANRELDLPEDDPAGESVIRVMYSFACSFEDALKGSPSLSENQ